MKASITYLIGQQCSFDLKVSTAPLIIHEDKRFYQSYQPITIEEGRRRIDVGYEQAGLLIEALTEARQEMERECEYPTCIRTNSEYPGKVLHYELKTLPIVVPAHPLDDGLDPSD